MNRIVLLLPFFISSLCLAQDMETPSNPEPSEIKSPKKSKAKLDFALEGMVGFSMWQDFYAFNVGGPSLKLRITEDLSIGVGALPSFYVYEGRTGARLGVSPRVDYKQWVFITPFLHMDSRDEWVFSVGLGYKFNH
ncbi:hypothetical protein [Pleomorphovibrio marinus]|uniref:hypothetical protein n=1 Tax=Pleomorphovibrio marinus TaxID=2164132 RepID=UPI000E0B8B7A|nr:hypothetical protein [Pleomorphovibrio marinus]